jgi:signal peptidase I
LLQLASLSNFLAQLFLMEILSSWPWKIGIFAILLAFRLALYFVEAPQRAQRSKSSTRSAGENAENGSGWAETLDSLLITIGLVFFIVQPFILQPFYIPSGSMENTLQWTPVQDRLLASRWIYRLRAPQRGEVVVFQPPRQAVYQLGNTDDDYIKRCVGVPGDIIYADKTRTYFRNGVKMVEPYAKWTSPLITPEGQQLSYSYDMKIVDGKMYSREYEAPNVPAAGSSGQWHYQPEPNGSDVPPPVVVPPDQQDDITRATPGAIPPGMFLMLGDNRNNSSDGHVWGFVPRANVVGKAMCVFWPLSRIGTLDRMSAAATSVTPRSNPNAVPVGRTQNGSPITRQ